MYYLSSVNAELLKTYTIRDNYDFGSEALPKISSEKFKNKQMVIQTKDGGTTTKPIYPRIFNKIVLTLENCLLPESKLEETPSHVDGLDKETEQDLRILGCELIQTAGILLRLPQVAMATGQVLFQRFYYSKSFVRHNMEITAMSCLCLASKIEESLRRIRDVINVFHHIKQVRSQKDITPMILDQTYTTLKTQVIKAERRVLKELGFCVHVKHPHKLIVLYLQVLGYEKNEKLMQIAWNFMNDSLRTDVFMRYHPETIACACIYLTARRLGIALPSNPAWYKIFKVSEDDLMDICYRIMHLYKRPKPNVEKLEEAVEELKKKYIESRNKTRLEHNIMPAVTTVDRNNASHNAWGGFISRAIPLPINESKLSLKRSHSRSRSRTRSRSRSPADDNRSRQSKKSRHRSKTPIRNKRKSRNYSRSLSSSPHGKHRKRFVRKSSRDRSDHYLNGERKERDRNHRDRGRDKDRTKHDRYVRMNNHRLSKHRDRSRDRKR